MNYIGKIVSNVKGFYNEINSATLTGAIDVVIVEQDDGTYLCSPFHVRFGKIGVLRSREKVVDIEINGEPVDIHMKLGESGEAFFVEESDDIEIPIHLATSPLPSHPDLAAEVAKLHAEAHASSDEGQEPSEQRSAAEVTIRIEPSEAFVYPDPDNPSAEDLTEPPILGATADPQRPAAKTFKAQAIQGNQTLDISSFKPISHLDNMGPPSEEDWRENTTMTEAEIEEMKSKQKRRRRKRSTVNRRKSRDAAKLEEGLIAPEDIFQMDEDIPNDQKLNLPQEEEEEPPKFGMRISHSAPEWFIPRHPYSDGELTPPCSPNTHQMNVAQLLLARNEGSPIRSRPTTPKSDTEYEIHRQEVQSQSQRREEMWSWGWGELPVPPTRNESDKRHEQAQSDDESAKAQIAKQQGSTQEQQGVLKGMLKFMSKNKTGTDQKDGGARNKEKEGIYLDELNFDDMDPEVTALYFPPRRKNTSGSHSSSGKTHPKDEDVGSGNGPSLPHSPHSLDGHMAPNVDSDIEERHPYFDYKSYGDIAFSLCGGLEEKDCNMSGDRFLGAIVTYDDFSENTSLLYDPNLVIRISGRYYNWKTAAPVVMALVCFQRPLMEKTISTLVEEHMPKKKKVEGRSYSWFPWGRQQQQLAAASIEDAKKDPADCDKPLVEEPNRDFEHKQQDDSALTEFSHSDTAPFRPRTSSEPPTPTRIRNRLTPPNSIDLDSDSGKVKKYKKELRLSAEQIRKLNLKEGSNETTFSVTTAYQGTTKCMCHVYLWKHDDKVVISDIDGTITKSDVLGHIMPIIGRDWAQSGVAHLFSKIESNGYKFLYLSARAIGQADQTRDYLRSVKQDNVELPDGPLLLSPSSLISALHREVIEKKPEEFKISCLRDVQQLFRESNPFYAGYGNKINDVWSYRAVGIPMGRIFTINHKGELRNELTETSRSSYFNQSYVVDHVFPPLLRSPGRSGNLTQDLEGAEMYSNFTFWRLIPSAEGVEVEIKEPTVDPETVAAAAPKAKA